MAYPLIPWIEQRFLNDLGAPLAGGFVYSYVAGTATPKNTYTDVEGSVAHANPIELDANGRPPSPIYLIKGEGYKFVVCDANLVQMYVVDDIYDGEAAVAPEAAVTIQSQYLSADLTLADGVWTQAISPALSITATGLYVITAQVSFDNAGGAYVFRAQIRVNDATVAREMCGGNVGDQYVQGHLTRLASLTDGDTVSLYAEVQGGAFDLIGGETYTWMQLVQVG